MHASPPAFLAPRTEKACFIPTRAGENSPASPPLGVHIRPVFADLDFHLEGDADIDRMFHGFPEQGGGLRHFGIRTFQ